MASKLGAIVDLAEAQGLAVRSVLVSNSALVSDGHVEAELRWRDTTIKLEAKGPVANEVALRMIGVIAKVDDEPS